MVLLRLDLRVAFFFATFFSPFCLALLSSFVVGLRSRPLRRGADWCLVDLLSLFVVAVLTDWSSSVAADLRFLSFLVLSGELVIFDRAFLVVVVVVCALLRVFLFFLTGVVPRLYATFVNLSLYSFDLLS